MWVGDPDRLLHPPVSGRAAGSCDRHIAGRNLFHRLRYAQVTRRQAQSSARKLRNRDAGGNPLLARGDILASSVNVDCRR